MYQFSEGLFRRAGASRFMESLQAACGAHWDHEPTPNPSQEGNFRAGDECLIPSQEGNGQDADN